MDWRRKLTQVFQPDSYFCDKLWAAVSVRWNGDVEPCSCAYGEFEVQNAFDSSVHEIWNSAPYVATRRYLNEEAAGQTPEATPEVFPICTNCPVPLIDRMQVVRWRLKGFTPRLWWKSRGDELWRTKYKNYRQLQRHLATPCETIPYMPIIANIDVANICNLRCPFCVAGTESLTHPRGMMSMEHFERLLEELGPTLLYLELYRYGEPMLNKHLPEMIELASQKYKIATRISSNLSMPLKDDTIQRLVRSGLDELFIAADGTTQEVYEQYRRRGKLDVVLENVKALVAARRAAGRKTPRLVWQMLVFAHNEHQVPDVYRMTRELGVDDVLEIQPQIPKFDDSQKWASSRGARDAKDERLVRQIRDVRVERVKDRLRIEADTINTTREQWVRTGANPFRVGVKLYAADKTTFLHELGRLELPENLLPGEEGTATGELPSPAEPGDYWLKLDVLREDLYWYEWRTGHRSEPAWVQLKAE
ncbi:radical SAM protein [bacterium]|nr:radical SAM protein [bacterium]